MPELSIIMPCLNEAENLRFILDRLSCVCERSHLDVETLIVDDSSDDNTYSTAIQLQSNHPSLNIHVFQRPRPRCGYGAVVRYGMERAAGNYCIFVSADGVDPLELIPLFLEHVRNGTELVQCSRYLNKNDNKNIPLKYKFFHIIYRTLVRVIFREKIPDSTYAFKMFDRARLMSLGLRSNRFSISPEITFKTILNGGKIIFIPSSQGVRQRDVSKFIFNKEGYGYVYVLYRALLHRLGIRAYA